jgi:hypothetical protein
LLRNAEPNHRNAEPNHRNVKPNLCNFELNHRNGKPNHRNGKRLLRSAGLIVPLGICQLADRFCVCDASLIKIYNPGFELVANHKEYLYSSALGYSGEKRVG